MIHLKDQVMKNHEIFGALDPSHTTVNLENAKKCTALQEVYLLGLKSLVVERIFVRLAECDSCISS